jgi:carbonic anhydrase
MESLLNGVRKFQETCFSADREHFEKLASGQAPRALFITCSDSRIDPNLLTQTKPGEIFVLRNAGNIVPPYDPHGSGESATIEYALSVLKIRDIVVCGHSDCGAVKALTHPEKNSALPAVSGWLKHIQPKLSEHVETGYPADKHSILDRLIERNVLLQLGHLQTHPSVSDGLITGQVQLHAWVYQIDKGSVRIHDEQFSGFTLLDRNNGSTERELRAVVQPTRAIGVHP